MKLECADQIFDISGKTHIMGIINCTPDSFYANSRYVDISTVVETGIRMVEDGADFIDIGGESSRPGADLVPIDEELQRVIPVITALADEISVPISVDTYKAEVARQALAAGAIIVNDISALQFDPAMASVVANSGSPVILMHIKGRPKEMQNNPQYENVKNEVYSYLQERIKFAVHAGIAKEKIIIDPGIGFGKQLDHNYLLLQQLGAFRNLRCPLLVGLSRKSFIQGILQLPASESLEGTIAANTLAILNGANILRVHDVLAARRAADIVDYYLNM